MADRRDVIATVFQGVVNRMKSGYLLRDVINKVDGIHFTTSDELHTLGALYESMLREMRDAAGDSGEFYTPRPVVRFMVEVIDPAPRRDGARPRLRHRRVPGRDLSRISTSSARPCRTGSSCRSSLVGCEAKPLPYLLAQMNLLLHGLEAPQIDPRQQPALQAHRDRREGSRRCDPHQSALRR